MASTTSRADPIRGEGRRTTLAELAETLTRRRIELDDVPVPRNAGTRRTASKRALLTEINEAGGAW